MNAGPGRIPQWMVTLHYCRELGLPVRVFTDENANAYLCDEKAGMRAPVRHRTAKADMYGFAGDYLSHTDAWQHGAFTSARKAVTALHSRVLT